MSSRVPIFSASSRNNRITVLSISFACCTEFPQLERSSSGQYATYVSPSLKTIISKFILIIGRHRSGQTANWRSIPFLLFRVLLTLPHITDPSDEPAHRKSCQSHDRG